MATMAQDQRLNQTADMDQKSKQAFRTIAEVARELRVEAHVLRFWETKFSKIKPMKLRGGRRYYRPEDILLIRDIKELLYDKGYTIRGVQKLLQRKGGMQELAMNAANDAHPPAVNDSVALVQVPEKPQTPSPVEIQQKISAAVEKAIIDLQKKHDQQLTEMKNKLADAQNQQNDYRNKIQSIESQLAEYQKTLKPVVRELDEIKSLLDKAVAV
jgi:DNA-binding transcriptional MerR regulator